MAKKKPKPANSLKNYVNTFVADERHAQAIIHLDKLYHVHPMNKKWWAAKISSDAKMDHVVHVAVHGESRMVVGFIVTSYNTKPDTIKIERLVVHRDYRRSKIATMLVLRAWSERPPMVSKLVYIVPELDLDTQLFLKATGFRARLPIEAEAFPGYVSPAGIRFLFQEK